MLPKIPPTEASDTLSDSNAIDISQEFKPEFSAYQRHILLQVDCSEVVRLRRNQTMI